MPMSAPSLLPDGIAEDVAVAVLRHLEWQPDSFSVVFLFADIGPTTALIDWLSRNPALQGLPIERHEADDSFVGDADAWLDSLLARLADTDTDTDTDSAAPPRGSLWLLLHRHPADGRWNQARQRLLARVNERRFLLEQQFRRPLVMVLPLRFRDAARRIAPDLWHVRAFSHELAAGLAKQTWPSDHSGRQSAVSLSDGAVAAPSGAYAAWLQAWQGGDPAKVHLALPTPAINELLKLGRPADALEVALQAEAEARRRASLLTDAAAGPALRDVSVALNNVGKVAQAQGDWAQADKAYQESLEIDRQLVERLGGTPEALRDVSVSLNNVGRVAQAQGDWAQADKVWRESLDIRRQLVERLGGTPEALRDVSVSLNNVGQVARAQGDWAQADMAYRECLAISRQLVERLGGTPDALRDVSVSLNNLGQLAGEQGDWAQAETAFRESLEIRRQLVERLGGTPEALRDVSVSLNNAGRVARAQGDWAQADKVWRESLEISRQLVERLGGTP